MSIRELFEKEHKIPEWIEWNPETENYDGVESYFADPTYYRALWTGYKSGWKASRKSIVIPDWHYQNGSSAVFVSDIVDAIRNDP